jgi:hypothetical protein
VTAAANASIPVRVTMLDTWDDIHLAVPASMPIADLKRNVLARSRIRRPAGDYVVKFNGAELYEEGNTVAGAGITSNSALIVLRRRRSPVR